MFKILWNVILFADQGYKKHYILKICSSTIIFSPPPEIQEIIIVTIAHVNSFHKKIY